MRRSKKISLFLGIIILVFIGVAALKLMHTVPEFQHLDKMTFSHGPHVDTDVDVESDSGMYSSVQHAWNSVFKNSPKTNRGTRTTATSTTPVTATSSSGTSSTSTSVSNATSTASTTSTASSSSSSSGSTLSFGIAAGGSLISMSSAKLEAYFQLLKNLGVQWVRWDVDWNVVQNGGPTVYDWDGPDRVAAMAQKYNIKSLGIITYAPQWSLAGGCVEAGQCSPADPQLFSNFAGLAAARYKGMISYWEVWNEPNVATPEYSRPNIAQYSALLKATYSAIKKANPQAVVLSGSLAPASNNSDGDIAPVTFIQGLYANGAQNSFDAIGWHPYTYPASPDYVASWNSWQQMGTIRTYMVAQGDGAKKIWLTEYGAPTGGSGQSKNLNQLTFIYGSDYMTETAQQQMAQKALELYQKDKAFFGPLFWYSLKDEGTDRSTPENFFGLLRYDGSKKPAYDIFRNAVTATSTQ